MEVVFFLLLFYLGICTFGMHWIEHTLIHVSYITPAQAFFLYVFFYTRYTRYITIWRRRQQDILFVFWTWGCQLYSSTKRDTNGEEGDDCWQSQEDWFLFPIVCVFITPCLGRSVVLSFLVGVRMLRLAWMRCTVFKPLFN